MANFSSNDTSTIVTLGEIVELVIPRYITLLTKTFGVFGKLHTNLISHLFGIENQRYH